MSSSSTVLGRDHFEYLARRTRQVDDAFLVRLKEEAEAEGIPAIWISPEQAGFMQILLRLARAEHVLEVGTLAGYSAICMARALPAAGRVTTLELEPAHAAFAERKVAESDVRGRVEVRCGRAIDLLPDFDARSVDAVFIDADKESYAAYLEHALRVVRPGGLVMVDNAFAFGRLLEPGDQGESVAAVRAFNDHMAQVDALQSVICPLGDGLWVGVREPDGAAR